MRDDPMEIFRVKITSLENLTFASWQVTLAMRKGPLGPWLVGGYIRGWQTTQVGGDYNKPL